MMIRKLEFDSCSDPHRNGPVIYTPGSQSTTKWQNESATSSISYGRTGVAVSEDSNSITTGSDSYEIDCEAVLATPTLAPLPVDYRPTR